MPKFLRRSIWPLAFFAAVLLATLAPTPASAKDTWIKVQSKNFTLIGNAGEAELRKTATHLEQFREAISRLLAQAKINSSIPTTVVVFKSDSSYGPFKPQYRGKTNTNVAGYFLAGPDMNYITLTTEARAESPYHVIFHEFFHFLVGNNMLHAPVWLNEGLAEFYSTFETFDDDQRFKVGSPLEGHLRVLEHYTFMPLKTLLNVTHSSPEYNDPIKTAVFYAESWALVHYLLLGNGGARKPQLIEFMRNLPTGMTVEENFRRSFQADYKKIEGELRSYIRQTRYPVMVATLTKPLEFDKQMQTAALSEAEVNYYLGDLLLRNNRLDEAEAHLQKALGQEKAMAKAGISLAVLRLRQRRFDEARTLLQSSIAADPQNYLGPLDYAEGLSQTGHYQEALEYYHRAAALKPAASGPHAGLGFTYTALGREKEAAAEFQQALKLDPLSQDFYHSRSFTYLSLNRGGLAATAARLALQLQGWRELSAMYMILTAHFGYRQEHKVAEADDMLKQAAAVVDHTLWPYPVIRYLQHELTAEQLLAQATDSDKQTEAHTYLGLDLSLNGKREEALQHLRWVKDHGNKHFYEYPVAVAELERLEKGAGT
jgi:tetratricopeptide (TPR) repeat protein